jgi:hypothetical protein
MTRPRMCADCGIRPIAYLGRKQCYECKPPSYRGVPACRRCGSRNNYFTNGLCRRCHRSGGWIDSCRDCFAWGVTQRHGWLCQACQAWHHRFGDAEPCRSCARVVVLNQSGYCRLCCRQATLKRTPHRSIDISAANQAGQQLFLADMLRQKYDRVSYAQTLRTTAAEPNVHHKTHSYPVNWRQLLLFQADDSTRDISAGTARGWPPPPLPDLAAVLHDRLIDHAAQHGWGRSTTITTDYAIRVLLALQDTPGAALSATQITAVLLQLPNGSARAVREVLAPIGMLDDDRPPPLQAWFAERTNDLPEPMTSQLRQWLSIMREGSRTPPRSRPRDPGTIYSQLCGIVPAAHLWAAAGHDTLRTITPQDLRDVLPSDPLRRFATIHGIRSLFRVLKAHRVTFTNPAARLRQPSLQPTQPLPINLDAVRQALNSPNPPQAALAALIAFHAPRSRELRALHLTDIRDSRLHLPHRTILLAAPAQDRLSHWFTERARRWPNTTNPHLFINHHTAGRATPVTNEWIRNTLGIPAKRIRDDRILHEAITNHGDARRLCDLFGINIISALRYTDICDNAQQVTSAQNHGPFSSATHPHS